ncbi:hypothetical protein LVJ82_00050 [Vitreoscilla massiliensis]|uniref:Lipocalin-like domain-containing protein n=1 Tax=Vitreoscilla massiliensis TaxID=1689272 RepID=A0ABY4E261_9NEIS|nr:hypothetical protein [Vitreoscilla massiliensis]UOO89413.1 hypothetical protein LVJ82_00050 [Vitreoscilla massiliensis]
MFLSDVIPTKKTRLWALAALLGLASSLQAAPVTVAQVQGHWRLQQAGRIDTQVTPEQEQPYDFNRCRLQRSYSLRADAYAIYQDVEGEEGACVLLEPRLSYWRLDGTHIVFYTEQQTLETAEISIDSAGRLRLVHEFALDIEPDKQQAWGWGNTLKTYEVLER